jgi:hypothetical protein
MTTENGQHESQPAAAVDGIETTAPTGELWFEILERLREVQESQTRLAGAIHGLGMMVQDALGPEATKEIAAHLPGVTLDLAAEHVQVPPAPPAVSGETAPPDVAEASRPDAAGKLPPESESTRAPDADLTFKTAAPPADRLITSVETSALRARSGAKEVQEQLDTTEVPEPVFYVPPFDEEVLPATSVAELTATALDDVLVSEFGPDRPPRPSASTSTTSEVVATPVTATTPETVTPREAVMAPADADTRRSVRAEANGLAPRADPGDIGPTIDPSRILDILLGTPRTVSEMTSPTDTALTPDASHTNGTTPPPVVSSEQPLLAPPPPPPPPPPPVFSDHVYPAPSVFTAEPDAVTPSTFVSEPAPAPPVFSDPPPPPPVFSDSVAPAPSVFTAEPDPSPAETASVVDDVEPHHPVFTNQESTQATPTEVLASGDGPLFSLGEPPAPHLAVPPPRPDPQLMPETTPLVTGSDPQSAFVETPFVIEEADEEEALESAPQVTSAATMATEILAATPDVPAMAAPELRESELISKDLTLIARGRKKRFRLH